MIDIEDLTEEELKVIKEFYVKLSRLSTKKDVFSTHSIDEAENNSNQKTGKQKSAAAPKKQAR